MPQSQNPRQHHYIPKFYLKRWTSGKGTLVQFSKLHGDIVKALRVHPKKTGWVDRLYEMRGVPPERAHLFETTFFKPVDTRAANVLAKMESGDFNLNDMERSAWNDFIMSLILRHPQSVAGVRAHLERDIARTPKYRRAHFVLPSKSPADVEKAMAELSTEDGLGRLTMATLTQAIRGLKTANAFINLQWGLISTPVLARRSLPRTGRSFGRVR